MKVQAFFAVTTTPHMGNANGYLNAQGEIARARTGHVLTRDASKAQAAVARYLARNPKNRAEVRSTEAFSEWVK